MDTSKVDRKTSAKSAIQEPGLVSEDMQDKLTRRLIEGLFILTVAMAAYFILAFISYDANDPSWSYVGGSEQVNNYAGKLGAWFADVFFSLLGYGAYSIPLILTYRAWLFFRDREGFDSRDWPGFFVVCIGVIFVLLSVTGLTAINTPLSASSLPSGNGGLLGEMLAAEFLPGFGLAGGRLVLFTLFFIGVTISTDISWLQLIERIGHTVVTSSTELYEKWAQRERVMPIDEPEDCDADDMDVDAAVEAFEKSTRSFSLPSLPFFKSKPAVSDWHESDDQDEEDFEQYEPEDDLDVEESEVNAENGKRGLLAGFSFNKRFSAQAHDEPSPERMEPTFGSAILQDVETQVATTIQENGICPVKDALPAIPEALVPEPIVVAKPAIKITPAIPDSEPSDKAIKDKQELLFDDSEALPSLGLLLEEPKDNKKGYSAEVLEAISTLLEEKLLEFKVEVKVTAVLPGPVVTRFEIQPKPGTKASTISNLSTDLARSLAVQSVRVVEVITGKSVMGIEIPNKNREMVYFSSVIGSKAFEESKSPLTLALGHDIGGQAVLADLAKMPHLLVAGTTGSGKSVGVNGMILSILFKSTPEEVRLILVDPKMLELSVYDDIPHLLTPVITDMKDAANGLRWCVNEMERRYKLMSKLGVRNMAGYNKKVEDAIKAGEPLLDPLWQAELEFMAGEDLPPAPPLETLPYIVVVIDEFADMIMVVGKKVEELIARIAQKARAAGIHLILATQRPSVDVITGLIKANVPTRMAFRVSSKIDSRTILDQGGAEQLLGHGDMLFMPPGESMTVRVHGAFVADDEVHAVVESWKKRGKPNYIVGLLETGDSAEIAGIASESSGGAEEQDALYDEAVAFVCDTRKASISSVQRKLRIGYNRAARMIEAMEEAGVVSSPGNSGLREVLAPPAVSAH
ncbi:MAG: DNA translocase FtsK 4TM domain-containing protein [Pseudomonadales bacterium]|nr:DNA translocase FtsK 4TM domain-containing protein [Pseudomonadales bacterium]